LIVKDGVVEHEVNYASIRWTCTNCANKEKEIGDGPSDCKICRLGDASPQEPESMQRHRAWSGAEVTSPLDSFVDWLIATYRGKYKAVLYTHYGSRFDEHFIMRALYARKIVPQLAVNGNYDYDIYTIMIHVKFVF
jgi:hypothetical protein